MGSNMDPTQRFIKDSIAIEIHQKSNRDPIDISNPTDSTPTGTHKPGVQIVKVLAGK